LLFVESLERSNVSITYRLAMLILKRHREGKRNLGIWVRRLEGVRTAEFPIGRRILGGRNPKPVSGEYTAETDNRLLYVKVA
jgi:hypothetical protein